MVVDKIYNEDCLFRLSRLSDECVDMIVTDPPYRIIAGGVTIEECKGEMKGIMNKRCVSDGTRCSNRWIKKDGSVPAAIKSGRMFSHNDIKFSEWLPQCYRVLKNGTHAYFMINSRNLKKLWTEAEKVGFVFVNLLAWRKNNATPNKYYMQQLEFILMFRKGAARKINDMGTTNCLSVPNIIGNKQHPTEKPVSLMRILIENSSQRGDIVLDPFIGSGTTAIARIQSDRRYIGCEIDTKYYEIATHRINTENIQTTLF